MKLKIKVKRINKNIPLPEVTENGDWIDLRAAQDIDIRAAQAGVQYKEGNEKYRDICIPIVYIPLGVAMELPKGFEAIIASRSSSPKKLKVFIPCGKGIVDNSYNGNDDQWHYVASPIDNTSIKKGDRICQFRIQLSQKATIWQKLKWLFSSGIELIEVNELKEKNRGMNVTGIK